MCARESLSGCVKSLLVVKSVVLMREKDCDFLAGRSSQYVWWCATCVIKGRLTFEGRGAVKSFHCNLEDFCKRRWKLFSGYFPTEKRSVSGVKLFTTDVHWRVEFRKVFFSVGLSWDFLRGMSLKWLQFFLNAWINSFFFKKEVVLIINWNDCKKMLQMFKSTILANIKWLIC